jgi:NAD-dependent deacetylase
MGYISTDILNAANAINQAEYVIALTGAGISKESNVPTFRGVDGLWKEYNAMDLATPEAFERDPNLVWQWYSWRQGLIGSCNPNPAHDVLAKWEARGLLKTLITQNVDGLHRRAGSKNVLEVHGDLWALKCTGCSHKSRLTEPALGIPSCPECGSNLRPDVVWFGERLNERLMASVFEELERADVCLVIGTSALVQPAASFPLIVKRHGGLLIELNVEPTTLSNAVDICLSGKAGEIMPLLDRTL